MNSYLWQFIQNNFNNYNSNEIDNLIDNLPKDNLNEFGVDPFGFDPKSLKMTLPFALWLYKKYFRCEVFGQKNLTNKRMLVIANHSGQLPFDGLMIFVAFITATNPARILRAMTEKWCAELPFISSIYARNGSIIGEPKSCEKLLNTDEAVLVFPEGVKGITKLFSQRYKLANFGTGFVKLAVKTNSPIVPVALIGAEEQAPSIANVSTLSKIFQLPAFPLIFPQIIPLPLPTKYRIYIGEPIILHTSDAEDPKQNQAIANKIKSTLQGMINNGLDQRKNIFY
jgi:1-acyl-sn-glycerol-3-phosphate acyltransferase